MTDQNSDKPKSQKRSFKEQILAELEEANRLRKQREEELNAVKSSLHEELAERQQKELEAKRAARKTAELLVEYEAAKLKEEKALKDKIALSIKAKQLLEQQKELEKSEPEQSVVLKSHSELADDYIEAQEDSSGLFTVTIGESVTSESVPNDEQQIVRISEDDSIVAQIEKEEQELNVKSESQDSEHEKVNSEPDKIRRGRQKKTNKIAKRVSTYLILGILAFIVLGGILGVTYISNALKPVNPNDSTYVQVEIPSGSGNKLIGKILQKSGVIKNAQIFNFYTKFKNYTNFQSGYYNFQKSMSLDDIATELQNGGTSEPTKPAEGKILIKEGYTIKQIAKAIEVNSASKTKKATRFSSAAFLKLIQNQKFIDKMAEKYPKLLGSLPNKSTVTYQLEGYLFPATYNYYKETSLEGLVDDMLGAMNANLANFYTEITAKNMTVNQILSMASLLEKEGSTDDDRRQIASVFYNRLAAAMPLQSNIAILYAMGKLGEKTTLAEDATINTKIDSPFNVYQNQGLTPGPVDSPGLSAIKAAVEPSSTDYYYFVADVKTGKVYYSTTYEEHTENVEKYINSQINQ